ncbi:MAG: SLC13 family permease [Kiritimatiellia bacterium]
MQDEMATAPLSTGAFIKKILLLVALSSGIASCGRFIGLSGEQQLTTGVFLSAVIGTLFFWNLRLSIAFLGVSALIMTRAMTIPQYVGSIEMPIILFLIGMMIILGCLEDLGFFTWIVQSIISLPRMSARRFIAIVCVAAMLLACAIDEVTSIIIIATLMFQVCGRLKTNPTPFIMIAVIATNIGSAGTMMGNPVGILIGAKAGFTFGDFIRWSFPVVLICTAANIALLFFLFRKELRLFDERLLEHAAAGGGIEPGVRIPYKRSLFILGLVLLCIALHHQAEQLLGIEKNSVLFLAPIFCAAGVMLYRRDRARHYVEHSVDLWTLLFFMMFFAIAGALKHSGVTEVLAHKFTGAVSGNTGMLVAVVIGVSAIGSAFVDNVVFVAAFAPIVEGLRATGAVVTPLWWALLFGACFGGNITIIGSTANIVALGMLEKQAHAHIRFKDWLKIGLASAALTCGIATVWVQLTMPHMKEASPHEPEIKMGGAVETTAPIIPDSP